MKKFIIAMLASSALAMAVPVVAQAHDQQDVASSDESWNNGGETYADFDQEYQHIWQGIQHGLSDGSYTRRDAYRFYRQMRNIRARANWEQQSGNYDPEATQAQLESLHERLHIAHERGHQRLDSYGANNDWRGGNNGGYGRNDGGYGNNGGGYGANNGYGGNQYGH